MSITKDARDLYQQVIVDHGRCPRNFGKLEEHSCCKCGSNPLCGDELKLYLKTKDGKVIDAKFEGSGCAISMASASLMTQMIKDKTVDEVKELFANVRNMLKDGEKDPCELEKVGKLSVLQGVCDYPSRVKCATLAWHVLKAAIENEASIVTSEED